MTNLLKANAIFVFSEKGRNAFLQLKNALVHKPVLYLYHVNVETELHTDACMFGFGAILLQGYDDNAFHPVYYASGKTTPAEQNYSSYGLEMLAIIKALKKFRIYLLGIPFKIVTDCRAFTLTTRKRDLCVRVARWALLLEEFQYVIEQGSSLSMQYVDALSRHPLPACLVVEECRDMLTPRLKKAQQEDDQLNKMIHLAEQNKLEGYVVKGGLLFEEVDGDIRLGVPKSMTFQIVREAHERGHFSVTKTENLLQRDY